MSMSLVRQVAFVAIAEERRRRAPQLERAINRAQQLLAEKTYHGRPSDKKRQHLANLVRRGWELARQVDSDAPIDSKIEVFWTTLEEMEQL